jgi:tetratricopeptide (TPR) repeat protein
MKQHSIVTILAISLLGACAAAQSRGSFSNSDAFNNPIGMSAGTHSHSLSGMVRTSDGQPAKEARVEVTDLRTGQVTASSYTNFAGAFEIPNLARGTYEVVAQLGLAEVREHVSLDESDAMVGLRLPPVATASEAGNRYSVSVAQMKVPEKARKAFNGAESAIKKKKLDDAEKHLAEALAIYPKYSEALTLRGILKLDSGQPDAARVDLEQAVESDNNYSLAYIALGATYNTLTRWDDALRVLDRGVGLAPTSWQGYFEMGKSFLGKAEYEAALRQFNRAEDMQPKYALVHLVKAHALLGLKNYSEAMSELEAYLEKEPTGAQSQEAKLTLEKVRAFSASNPK